MFDLLPDELMIMIMMRLNLRDFLNLSTVNRRLYRLSHDRQYIRQQLKIFQVDGYVEESKSEFFKFYKKRADRFSQEIAFFQKNKETVLDILNNIPNERRCLLGILRKIQECTNHLRQSFNDRYILEADRMLNALNKRIIFRQLILFEGSHLKLSCITRIPEQVIQTYAHQFKTVNKLELKENLLESIPATLSICEQLSSLNLYDNPISYLPKNIGDCRSLEYFYMCDGALSSLPSSFFLLSNLKWVSLCNMQLKDLSSDIIKLQQLTWLNLENNQLRRLPAELTQLNNLREIHLNNNQLRLTQTEEMLKYLRQRHINLSYLLKSQKSFVSALDNKVHSLEEPLHAKANNRCLFYYKKCLEKKKNRQNLEGLDLDNDTLMRRVRKK